jgi:hypothetical protein
MSMPSLLVTAFAMILTHLVSAQPLKKQKVAEDPEKALAVAIKLLESKDHTGFVKRFMPPDLLAKELEKRGIDHIANEELGDRAEEWLREFKLVKGMKPVFSDERTKATFNGKDENGKSVKVRFVLTDGKWYLW